jgi:DNA-binding helix-hairpin-helix protein with protein kinase domain
MNKSTHIFEVLGHSTLNKCSGHVWQGEGRCPYCANDQLNRQRNQEIITKALEILNTELFKKI